MTSSAEPTLSDDEATLVRYAGELGDALAAIVAPWLIRLVERRSPGLTADREIAARLADGAVIVEQEFRDLLRLDIAAQPTGPLEILRRAVRFPTAVLAEHDVTAVNRDEFSAANFPDDVYDLTPASFGAVDPSLHEPGLMWGAAKAHVHLRRRRDQAAPVRAEPRVVALSVDLMDRSKIGGAFPAVVFVRSAAKLTEAAAEADLVLVDLARLPDASQLSEIDARTVAFGSHVDEAVLAAAREAGAEAMPRSVFFRRISTEEL